MSEFREGLLEAMARVMGHCEPYAEDALDAGLDWLQEHADDIRREVYGLWAAAPGEPGDMLDDALSVLREEDE